MPVFGRVTSQLFNGFNADEIGVLTAMLERMRDNLATGNSSSLDGRARLRGDGTARGKGNDPAVAGQ